MTNEQFQQMLLDALKESSPSKALLKGLEKAFGSYVNLSHSANQLLLQSDGLAELECAHLPRKKRTHSDWANMHEFFLKEANQHGLEPYFIRSPISGLVYMSASSFDRDGGLCGTVSVVTEVDHHFTEMEKTRLRAAADCLALALRLEANTQPPQDTHAAWNHFLSQMREGAIPNREAMCTLLQTTSGLYFPTKIFLVTLAVYGGHVAPALFQECYRVLIQETGCLGVIVYEEQILALFEAANSHPIPVASETISRLAREHYLKAACSKLEDDLWQLPVMMELNAGAIRFARRYRMPGTIVSYEDAILYDMIFRTSSPTGSLEIFVSEKVQKIRQWDQTNSTDYYKTLCTYLRCNFHRTETAQQLYIHKTTLSYRLLRMSQQFGIDWESYDERLKLMMSVYLLEHFLD